MRVSEIEELLSGPEPDLHDEVLEERSVEDLETDILDDMAAVYNSLSLHPERGENGKAGGTNNFELLLNIASTDYASTEVKEADEYASLENSDDSTTEDKRHEFTTHGLLEIDKNKYKKNYEYDLSSKSEDLIRVFLEYLGDEYEEENITEQISKDLGAISVEGGGKDNLYSFLRLYENPDMSFSKLNPKVSGVQISNYNQKWKRRGLTEQDGRCFQLTDKGKKIAKAVLNHYNLLE